MHLVQCGPTTGGTVSHVATQVAHQVRRGLEVGVIAASDGVLTERCRAVGADVFIDPIMSPTNGDPARPGDPATLHDPGSRWRPDILHAHLVHAGFRGEELSAKLDVPLVYTQHMWNPIDSFLRAAVVAGKDFHVITVAHFAEEIVAEFLGDAARVHYVPNGVDVPVPSGFKVNKSPGPNVLYCGRLSPEKGADLAVIAFAVILRSLPGAKLHIVGTGPDEHLLRKMVSALDLTEHVDFHGSVSGALTAEIGVDVILASSRADAASLVLLEAMASGIPIVAAAVGGIPELVRHEVEGLLVAPDDPQGLAEAALRVLSRPDRGAVLVSRARDRYRAMFTADVMVERTCAVYEDVLRGQIADCAESSGFSPSPRA
ncbi:glycosyltransferase family 4 protein (plasmid) [Embleya sp. NBC_00888]|uniref:glycosyltransferase family 4 protein n=1 Tax=Embleya sp. NBC_00888 TaxID=2975960 RepID=UPI002F91859E|nr:glycosyltransferase family 4 protein [Embleya sp. NBC_00888]